MNHLLKKATLMATVCLIAICCNGQLVITDESNAQALAQKLVGDGVSISNVTFTGNSLMAGYFNNTNNTRPGLDSGIVLTSGRAKTTFSDDGLDGDGVTMAANTLASNGWTLPGDANLATAIGIPVAQLHDACVLEFDFIPLGDSVKFRYAFSSEEYDPLFACGVFNDAFAFFISGPGFTGLQNIALVPGTSLPVSIENINNVFDGGPDPLCPNNAAFYLDNTDNVYFNHEGITQVLTALAQVQPCQVYHLKLVIADNTDDIYDSGVFLEAKSLTSNSFQLTNLTQVDNTGASYLVEGCATGSLRIARQAATLFSQTINLGYGGTAVNGVDVQLLPSSITIPANETEVMLNIFPIVDNLPEGIETLKIYTLAPCGVLTPTDSAQIQIRDYDTLSVTTSMLTDTAVICRNGSVQLIANTGYSVYNWTPAPQLNNSSVINPLATPTADSTMFVCTSQEGTCHARDSAFIFWKRLKLNSKTDVNCHGASTGQISVTAGAEWVAPLNYSINNGAFQPNNSFNNLAIGSYTIKVKDATNCIDSIVVNIDQAFPDLNITNIETVNGSCTGAADAIIRVTATGGKAPLEYSVNGTTFQNNILFNVAPGTYTVTVRDNNGCTNAVPNISVQFDNTMTLSTGANPTICESKNVSLPAATNGTSVIWSPAATLNNATILNPVANPVVTTKYYIKSKLGICEKLDSVTVIVNPAPLANAGKDSTICFGGSTSLSASGGVSYNWSPSTYLSSTTVSNPAVTRPKTITYYLSVTDANGCTSLSKDNVVVTVSPPARLFAGFDAAVAMNQPLQLRALDINNIGFTKYHWTPERGLSNPFISDPVANLSDEYNYLVVTATTPSGCEGIDSLKINTYRGPEIYVANTFTPNGDGVNDVLKAFPVGMKSFSYFRIFNRFGEMVFSTTNANIGWDGKLKGALQQMNTFVWIAAAIDYKGNLIQRKGTVTMVQ